MPNARLVWVEECGHVPHLEQPDLTASTIVDFVKNGNPAKVFKREETGPDYVKKNICSVGGGRRMPVSQHCP